MNFAALKEQSVAGGPVTSSASATFIEGTLAAREGDTVQAHGDSPHKKVTIAKGSSGVNIEGHPAARVNDPATCGHSIQGGASGVLIGD